MHYVLPNNTVLLVNIQQFDPDPVVVNVNKLKPFRVQDEDLPIASKSDIKQMVLQNEDELPRTRPITIAIAIVTRPDSR